MDEEERRGERPLPLLQSSLSVAMLSVCVCLFLCHVCLSVLSICLQASMQVHALVNEWMINEWINE